MTVASPHKSEVDVLFSHPHVNPKSITIDTGLDNIAWGYKVNTAKYATYGGEVVQILSVYIDDVYLEGTVRTYADIESIYQFFSKYMIIATQGQDGRGSYDQTPVKMSYQARMWNFDIQPLSAPSFTYSRETVAPRWKLTAHVVDSSPDVGSIKDMISHHLLNGESNIALSGMISPGSGDPSQNPFQAPGTVHGETLTPYQEAETKSQIEKYTDYFHSLISSYTDGGDFLSVSSSIGSKPAFGSRSVENEIAQEIGKKK